MLIVQVARNLNIYLVILFYFDLEAEIFRLKKLIVKPRLTQINVNIH